MKPYSDITILVDRSGSMATIKHSMESALNEFFAKHRQIPSTRVTLAQFDDVNPLDIQFENRAVSEITRVTIDPRGWTPLYDAVCSAIDRTGIRLGAVKEEDRPDQVLFVIITDGQENHSKRFRSQDVKDRIATQRGTYNWQFVFLGSDEAGFDQAKSWGLNTSHIMLMNEQKIGDTFHDLGAKTVSYTSTVGAMRGTAKSASLMDYSAEDRAKLEKKRTTDDPTTTT